MLKPYIGQVVYYGYTIVTRTVVRPCMITNIHQDGTVDLERFGYFNLPKYLFNKEYSENLEGGKWTFVDRDRFTQLL